MSSKRDQLASILRKHNRGIITESEKDASINELLAEESHEIWQRLMEEYKGKDTIATPGIYEFHSWSNCSAFGVPFNCVDDGGLLQDADPVGKVFKIVRDDGVKAELKIVNKYSKEQGVYVDVLGREAPCYGEDVFLAIGQLDDYYFSNPEPQRENILIKVGEKGIHNLTVYAFHEPGRPIYSIDYPRWKPYMEMMRELKEAHRIEMQRLIDLLMK